MLYHLIDWLKEMDIRIPGSALLQFITSRVLLAVILSLVITTLFGKKLINYLLKKQVGESVRDLGLAGEQQKKGTPTMGGLIIILAILVPTLLLADLNKAYVRLMLFSTVWLGVIGFVDDYLKLRAKRLAQAQGVAYKKGDKDGLAGWFKILGQVGLGLIIGITLLVNENTKAWREYNGTPGTGTNVKVVKQQNTERYFVEANEPITTIPFVAGHEFNYAKLLPEALRGFTSVLYVLIVIFIVTAVSNGANITDGLDGLATGVSAIIGVCLGVFAYASGNLLLADYLNIMYIPNLGELSIFIGAMIGACVG
ncbi:MAG TPA: phospho-N-acetylmuramoyl-pentapeptide-transferase, partial [Flavihumibacter sp.]